METRRSVRACVCSGGGAKGAYQVGVLKRWMGDQNRDYDIFTGVSVGALNVAAISQHLGTMTPSQAAGWLEDFWIHTVKSNSSIYRKRFFWEAAALWSKSVYSSKPLQKLVHDNIDMRALRVSGKRVAVGAVSLDTGELVYGRETDDSFKDWVLASSAFPIFLDPIEINGQLWTDGGLKRVTPLAQAIRMGAEEIDVIMCSNPDLPFPWKRGEWWQFWKRSAVPAQVFRALQIYNDQVLEMDLKITGYKNDMARANPKYRNIRMRIVKPSEVLMHDSLHFDTNEVRRLIDIGYHDADRGILVG